MGTSCANQACDEGEPSLAEKEDHKGVSEQAQASRRWPTIVLWLAAAIPPAIAIWFVSGFSLVAPLFDHWGLFPIYARFASGHPALQDFLAPHNGLHVAVFARLFLAVLATATGWSLRAEMCAGFVLVFLTLYLLDRAFVRSSDEPPRPVVRAMMLFLTSALLFSPAQDWLWTWSIGFFHYFENAAIVLAVWALCSRRPHVPVVATAFIAATFNRFEGLFAWIIFAPVLVLRLRGNPTRTRLLTIYAVVAMLSCAALLGLVGRGHPGEMGAATTVGVGRRLLGALALGTSLVGMAPGLVLKASWDLGGIEAPYVLPGAITIAIFGALAAVALRTPRSREAAAPWISLGLFGLAFAFATAFARDNISLRHDFGLGPWYEASYSVTASLVGVGCVYVAALLASDVMKARVARRTQLLYTIATALFVANEVSALPRLARWRQDGHWDTRCFELAEYWAPWNTCFLPLADARLAERAGFAHLRRDVRFDDSAPSRGRIEEAKFVKRTSWSPSGVEIDGSVDLPGEAAGTVLGAFGDDRIFVTMMRRSELRRGRLRFSLLVPEAAARSHATVVHAWLYDARVGRFFPVDGAVGLAAFLRR